MPEYDLSNGKVKVTITGKVINTDYARVLAKKRDLGLDEIIMLDKVQKKKSLTEAEIEYLRAKGLIEGRKPNFHISSDVAEKTNLKAEYIKTRGLKDDHFKKLILEYLDKYKQASKEDIDNLLLDILPGVLDEKQRKNKIRNLVYALSKKDKTIENQGTNRYPKWVRVRYTLDILLKITPIHTFLPYAICQQRQNNFCSVFLWISSASILAISFSGRGLQWSFIIIADDLIFYSFGAISFTSLETGKTFQVTINTNCFYFIKLYTSKCLPLPLGSAGRPFENFMEG